MTTHQRLQHLTAQLAETLMTAVICVDEIRTTIHAEIEYVQTGHSNSGRNGNPRQRPLLDCSTFSVTWQGKNLPLGHTRPFWLLDRLARNPNQYVSHLDLLHDVWDDEELTTSTIRSVVRNLRDRLRDGGMDDLAAAIRGHNGHYVLDL